MTSNAFQLKAEKLEDAVRSMPQHLREKVFNNKYTSEQLLRGGNGVSFTLSTEQHDILTTACADFGLNHKKLPSSVQLASLLQPRQLDLFSNYRPLDRKMAVKVVRWIENHGPSSARKKTPTANKATVEGLVDDALDLIVEEQADGKGPPAVQPPPPPPQMTPSPNLTRAAVAPQLPPKVPMPHEVVTSTGPALVGAAAEEKAASSLAEWPQSPGRGSQQSRINTQRNSAAPPDAQQASNPAAAAYPHLPVRNIEVLSTNAEQHSNPQHGNPQHTNPQHNNNTVPNNPVHDIPTITQPPPANTQQHNNNSAATHALPQQSASGTTTISPAHLSARTTLHSSLAKLKLLPTNPTKGSEMSISDEEMVALAREHAQKGFKRAEEMARMAAGARGRLEEVRRGLSGEVV